MVINSTLRRRRHTFNLNSYYPQKDLNLFYYPDTRLSIYTLFSKIDSRLLRV